MTVVGIIRILVMFLALLLLWLDFYNYAKKNLTDTISLIWGIFGVILLLAGIHPFLWSWAGAAGERIYILFSLVFILIIIGLFAMSISVSKLLMKNQELAINLSLLNQENERIIQSLVKITGKSEMEIFGR